MIGFLPHKTALPVTVNGHELEEFHARMQSWPEITACEIDTGIFQGVGRSTMHLLQNRRGVRYMTCLIDFMAPEWAARISAFDALLARGAVEIDLGDGYLYRSILVSESAPKVAGETIATVEYRFQVMRHWPELTASVTTTLTATPVSVYCQSNFPRTDCRIRLPYDAALGAVTGIQVVLGGLGWYYHGSPSYDLIFDGINKVFSHGAVPVSNQVTWREFPYLAPGTNKVELWIDNEVATEPFQHAVEITYSPTFL